MIPEIRAVRTRRAEESGSIREITLPRTQLLIPSRRVNRWWRTIRALYRDSSALWREFRWSIVVFLLATLVGGYLYGELMVLAGYPRLPYIDLPYLMVMLMFFQAPGDAPPQPQLVAFWYIMPLIGIYIVGRGAVDFVRLFFDRSERRNAWEEAVASTYRNHVIVMGAGHLGLRVIRSLVSMGLEVVAIDSALKPESEAELRRLKVPLIAADGRLPDTMKNAGLRHAQAFIVCTSNDHLNLEVTMRARDLNPDVRIVVRMWDNQFTAQIRRFMNVEAVLSASDLAAPAFAASALNIEITQTLTVGDTDYSMIRLQVAPGSFLDGETIEALQDSNQIDIVLHGNGDRVNVHPAHNVKVCAGDTLVIFAQHHRITDIVARNRSKG
jgi:Trk K+ transport system NAD-binding subunit